MAVKLKIIRFESGFEDDLGERLRAAYPPVEAPLPPSLARAVASIGTAFGDGGSAGAARAPDRVAAHGVCIRSRIG